MYHTLDPLARELDNQVFVVQYLDNPFTVGIILRNQHNFFKQQFLLHTKVGDKKREMK